MMNNEEAPPIPPFHDVPQMQWAAAYDSMCIRIWDRDQVERNPTVDEVVSMLDEIKERALEMLK